MIPIGVAAGFEPQFVLINDYQFTKTANCRGVTNEQKGTNTKSRRLIQKKQLGYACAVKQVTKSALRLQ